jgi:glycosyltransferase involved in cell wall biosynthesis
MKILQLCLRFPFPPVDGGSMAMASTAKGLKQIGVDLVIAALNTSKHLASEKVIKKAKEDFKIEALYIDNRITPINTLLNLFEGKAFHVTRFYNKDVAAQIEDILKSNDFDAVVFESLFMAPYLGLVQKLSKAKTVLRSHNIEYQIWERVSEETNNWVKKRYLQLQTKRLKLYEESVSPRFDLVAAISPNDLEAYIKMGLGSKAFYLPFGIENTAERNREVNTTFKIGHIGSMDWIPNQEGLRWFLKDVWPLVNKENLTCEFAGRHMPSDIEKAQDDNLKVLGEVESSKEFLKGLDLLIVPLRSGSGVRIKVLESMAMGVPILATSVGYEGIGAKHNESIIEANSKSEFADAINKAKNGAFNLKVITQNAQQYLAEKHSPSATAQLLVKTIENGLGA